MIVTKRSGVDVGEAYVRARFPGRLHLTRGDSSWTVPEYLAARPGLKVESGFILYLVYYL
jgi:hypothetical protein